MLTMFGVVIVGEVPSTTAPLPVDEEMEIAGVAPPDDVNGDVPVTDVTVPSVGGLVLIIGFCLLDSMFGPALVGVTFVTMVSGRLVNATAPVSERFGVVPKDDNKGGEAVTLVRAPKIWPMLILPLI